MHQIGFINSDEVHFQKHISSTINMIDGRLQRLAWFILIAHVYVLLCNLYHFYRYKKCFWPRCVITCSSIRKRKLFFLKPDTLLMQLYQSCHGTSENSPFELSVLKTSKKYIYATNRIFFVVKWVKRLVLARTHFFFHP